MDVKKEAKFRVQIVELKTKKVRVVTVYPNNKNSPTLEEFKGKLIKAIKEDVK